LSLLACLLRNALRFLIVPSPPLFFLRGATHSLLIFFFTCRCSIRPRTSHRGCGENWCWPSSVALSPSATK
jgi:hypothetical protein